MLNIVQVFDDALYSDNPLVVCAPTGSGKTVIFELAIVRLMMKAEERGVKKKEMPKVVYSK